MLHPVQWMWGRRRCIFLAINRKSIFIKKRNSLINAFFILFSSVLSRYALRPSLNVSPAPPNSSFIPFPIYPLLDVSILLKPNIPPLVFPLPILPTPTRNPISFLSPFLPPNNPVLCLPSFLCIRVAKCEMRSLGKFCFILRSGIWKGSERSCY